jgi:hypothetical protein
LEFRLRYTDQDFKALPLINGIEVPQVEEANRELWQAWVELSDARGSGFSAEPISIVAVESWCRMHLVARRRRAAIWRTIRALDAKLLAHWAAK